MRTYLSIFGLISATVFALGSPSTADLVQDKPDRLYVASDTLSTDSYSDNVTRDSGGGVSEGQQWHHDDYFWTDANGGVGSRQDTRQSEVRDDTGVLWSSTNCTSSIMVWGTNGTGTETYTASDGSISSYPISVPLLTSEHCWVNDPRSPPFTVQNLGDNNWTTNTLREEYVRYSDTRWGLETGGRGNRSSLFRFSATATEILNKRAERPFYNVRSRPVAPERISVLAQAIRADTNLWLVLPDGTNLDVTPFVTGADFYKTDLWVQKFTPKISVNDRNLNLGTPEFCAGQFLSFKLGFHPPPELASQDSVWELPGPAVNESWQQGTNGSVNYRFSQTLLSNNTVSCWYTAGGGFAPGVGSWLGFPNGQRCFMEVQGMLNVVKPTMSAFDGSSSLVGFLWNPPVLQAVMQWTVAIDSTYDGAVGVTQLINGTNVCCNTDGAFRLDGTNEFYNATNQLGQAYTATNLATHVARLWSARTATAAPTAELLAEFQDYVRFRPAGSPNNIWVTLGTNSWSMDGAASLSGGLLRSNLPAASTLGPCDTFPFWTDEL